MAELERAYRLPLPGWPRAVFASDHLYDGGSLRVGEHVVARAESRNELLRGIGGVLPGGMGNAFVRLTMDGAIPRLAVAVDGRAAVAEDDLNAPTARSAWNHAFLALAASAAGFVASYLYLEKSNVQESLQAWKMAYHMAGWHLLLTFTLFPASVWGQRFGIRSVQAVSLLFFLIHLGIAIANAGATDASDVWIGVWNALSGLFFLAAVVYGNRAYRDMDPARGLDESASTGDRSRQTEET